MEFLYVVLACLVLIAIIVWGPAFVRHFMIGWRRGWARADARRREKERRDGSA